MKLDVIDKQLVYFLQDNAKITTKQLASHLSLSVTATYERIKKLEKSGVIKKYVAVVDKEKVGKKLMVFCHITLTRHTKANIAKFEKSVITLDEVLECVHVSGDYDYILKILVNSMEDYRRFLVNKLTAIQEIGSTQSTFVMNEVKNSTVVSV